MTRLRGQNKSWYGLQPQQDRSHNNFQRLANRFEGSHEAADDAYISHELQHWLKRSHTDACTCHKINTRRHPATFGPLATPTLTLMCHITSLHVRIFCRRCTTLSIEKHSSRYIAYSEFFGTMESAICMVFELWADID
jgi:hypothetical protein